MSKKGTSGNKYIGSSIDDFLKEEGIFEEAQAQAAKELEALALEGLESGAPLEVGPSYWKEKHRQLDERLKKTETQ